MDRNDLITKIVTNVRTLKSRFIPDAGTMRSDNITKAYQALLEDNLMADNIRFSWFGESASKFRTSGNDKFFTKLYSTNSTNDGVQTTELNQPYLSGNIAPNERYALNNPNGSSKYITHPTISFNANDSWSVTTVFNWNGSNNDAESLFGNGDDNTFLWINYGVNHNCAFSFIGASEILDLGQNITNNSGKIITLSLVYNGTNIKLYINSVLRSTTTCSGAASFSSILNAWWQSFNGKLYAHIIRSGALTQTQVTNEYNFFRSIYPEIETVKIGTQDWATSNLDVVATPMGNVIANVTDNTAWAASTTTYDNTYAATSGTVEQKTYAAVKAAAMWCYYNNDAALGAIYGKLYNWYAAKLLQMDIDYYNAANPLTPWNYRVPTSTDFTTLQTTLGGAAIAGGKMKKEGLNYWNSPNTGATNSSGFSALGGGQKDESSQALGAIESYWCVNANNRFYIFNSTQVLTEDNGTVKHLGISIRLIKN